jgi:hypothetical protein
MLLPGGLINTVKNKGDDNDNPLSKTFAFKEMTGEIELALMNNEQNVLINRVTTTLVHTLAQVGGQTPSHEVVLNLSVGDRQFLIRQLAKHLNLDTVWLTADCRVCSKPFDFLIQQSALPVKPASDSYPFTEVNTSQGKWTLRVPTGKDQERMSVSHEESIETLVRHLIVETDAPLPDYALTLDDLTCIEQALEETAPEVATEVITDCPACGKSNQLSINPYLCLELLGNTIFADIHTLASHYHWSERDILSLPRSRRQIYLRLVEKSRGMQNQGTVLPL